jgi:hypothetical protein
MTLKSDFYEKSSFPSWLHRREPAVELAPELRISAQIVAATDGRQSTVWAEASRHRLYPHGAAQAAVAAQPIVAR